jgi:hypothetical protein
MESVAVVGLFIQQVLESIDHLEDSVMKKCKWWPTDTIGWMEEGERKIGILLNCAPIEFEINRLEYPEMDRMYKKTGPQYGSNLGSRWLGSHQSWARAFFGSSRLRFRAPGGTLSRSFLGFKFCAPALLVFRAPRFLRSCFCTFNFFSCYWFSFCVPCFLSPTCAYIYIYTLTHTYICPHTHTYTPTPLCTYSPHTT